MNRTKHGRTVMMSVAFAFVFGHAALLLSQQPQASAGTPLYAVNAKYVNGMAPGYWATAGSGLALNLSSGTAYCGNPPAPVTYAGGALTLSPTSTNYIYLDPAANCAPAANTSGFFAGQIPVAEVVTGASSISAVTDERTWSSPNPAAMSGSGAVQISSLGTNQNITLAPSGTGASVVTNLEDKAGQVFNIKAYGALGDGATNDSPAFQAAYNAAVAAGGGTVLIPPSASCYLLSTAINMTSTTGAMQQVIIEGTTRGHGGVASGATDLICANTGGILFDVSGSDGITFKNVAATSQSGVTTPSLIGIYAARDSSNAGAQGIKVIDSTFDMVTHSSGTTYSFGAYLYGSEDDYFTRDNFTADYPLVVSATNAFSQNSAFITEATGTQSETQDSFTDMEFLSSGLGPFAYFRGTGNMTLTGHGWNTGQANPYPVALYNYALEFLNGNATMNVNFRQEGYPGFASVDLFLKNSRIYGTSAPAATPPLHGIEFTDASATLEGDQFHIADEYSAASSNYYYDASAGSPTGVAIVDNVSFYCGMETNCVNIPIGNYVTGGALYWKDVRWSGAGTNEYPVISFGGPITGSFTVPNTAIAASTCTSLSNITGTGAGYAAGSAFIAISPANYNGILFSVGNAGSILYPEACNVTSGSITPPATTVYWRIRQ